MIYIYIYIYNYNYRASVSDIYMYCAMIVKNNNNKIINYLKLTFECKLNICVCGGM